MILIDTMMLLRRCYARMDFLVNKANKPTGMEFGFLRSLEMLEKAYGGNVILCRDSKRNVRRGLDDRYKADRKPLDASFYERATDLIQFCQRRWPVAIAEGWEADDVMYTLSRSLHYRTLYSTPETRTEQPDLLDDPCYIYTNDDDLLAAVDDARRVKVVKSFQSNLYEWDEAKVVEKYGVLPSQLAELRAFTGDGSDNVRGVPRIPKKLIAELIAWCHGQSLAEDAALREIASADWSAAIAPLVKEHVESGQWHRSRDLLQLRDVSDVLEVMITTHDADADLKQLKTWGFKKLRLCEPYAKDLVDEDAEF